MTADGTPAVPDTEAAREALAAAASRHTEDARLGLDDARCSSCQEETWPCQTATALARLRAALARDVPAPTDEPHAILPHDWARREVLFLAREVVEYRDSQLEGAKLDQLAVAITTLDEKVAEHRAALSVAVSDRAGDAETRTALPVTLASVDDVRERVAEAIAQTIGHRKDYDTPDCPDADSTLGCQHPAGHPQEPGCEDCAEFGWPCSAALAAADAALAAIEAATVESRQVTTTRVESPWTEQR